MLNIHEEIETLYYTMSTASFMLNVSETEIRQWDDRFKLDIHRNRRGDRMPSKNDISRLIALKNLRKWFRNEGIDMITKDFDRIKDKGLDGIFLPKIMRLCQKGK